MSPTGTLIPVEEYLATVYRPDCDYVDGEVIERNMGERNHSRLQGVVTAYFYARESLWGIQAFPEQRVRVAPNRYRIPDVCVFLEPVPDEQVFTHPPFLCLEILSPSDTMSRMQSRIADYLAMGVPHVWVADPWTRRAYVCTQGAMVEAADGVLRAGDSAIVLPLAELWKS